jgi:hypothetical protein
MSHVQFKNAPMVSAVEVARMVNHWPAEKKLGLIQQLLLHRLPVVITLVIVAAVVFSSKIASPDGDA